MHAVINVNKPGGITSRQVVNRVQRLLRSPKAGHAGTLDPMATGVLLVCIGEATKITPFLVDLHKEYHATMKLGERTDTCDAEGRIVEAQGIEGISEDDVREMVMSFQGVIRQTPPMFSAVKVGGVALHKLARKGMSVDRKERTVEIKRISVIKIALPFVTMNISCSKGTYIRTLCDDIGQRLGCGAYVSSLLRTRIGDFSVDDAADPEHVAESRRGAFTIDDALSFLPQIHLDADEFRRARNGQRLAMSSFAESESSGFVRLKDATGALFGIGRREADHVIIERLFNLPGTA